MSSVAVRRQKMLFIWLQYYKCGTGRFIPADGICRCYYTELTLAFGSHPFSEIITVAPQYFLKSTEVAQESDVSAG